MPIDAGLTDIAVQLVAQLEVRAPALKQELLEIEARKLAIEAELDTAGLAPKRLLNFRPTIGSDYQCPRCWIGHENRSTLYPIGGGTRTEDYFRCSACNERIGVAV